MFVARIFGWPWGRFVFQLKKPLGLPNNRPWIAWNISCKVHSQPQVHFALGYGRNHRQGCCATGMILSYLRTYIPKEIGLKLLSEYEFRWKMNYWISVNFTCSRISVVCSFWSSRVYLQKVNTSLRNFLVLKFHVLQRNLFSTSEIFEEQLWKYSSTCS